jgi:hypothetical protein
MGKFVYENELFVFLAFFFWVHFVWVKFVYENELFVVLNPT